MQYFWHFCLVIFDLDKKSLMKMLCFRFCKNAFFLCRWQKTSSIFWLKYRFSVSQVTIEEYRYLILSWFRSSILTYYVYRFSRPTSTRYSECDINKYIYIYIKIYIDIFCWHSSFRNNIDIDITDTFEPEKEK